MSKPPLDHTKVMAIMSKVQLSSDYAREANERLSMVKASIWNRRDPSIYLVGAGENLMAAINTLVEAYNEVNGAGTLELEFIPTPDDDHPDL